MRVLESRIEGLAKHMEFVAGRISEIEGTMSSIAEVSKAKGDVVFHVGGEAFMPAKPSGDGKVIVVIGADVAMEKTVDEARALLESRKKEAEDVMRHVQKDIEYLTKKMESAAAGLEDEGGK